MSYMPPFQDEEEEIKLEINVLKKVRWKQIWVRCLLIFWSWEDAELLYKWVSANCNNSAESFMSYQYNIYDNISFAVFKSSQHCDILWCFHQEESSWQRWPALGKNCTVILLHLPVFTQLSIQFPMFCYWSVPQQLLPCKCWCKV